MTRKRRDRERYSSNGCLQCKAGHVKEVGIANTLDYRGCSFSVLQCDEQKPKCRRCTRRARPCTYANNTGFSQLPRATAVSLPQTPPESSSTLSTLPYGHGHGRSTSNGNNVLSARISLPMVAPSPTALNMPHLQLLYHFIAVTSEGLGVDPISRDAWKATIPEIALSHEFLMHGILAVAALHIAHMRPEQRTLHWERAAMHRDRALELQEKAMASASPDNADALLACSLLVIYFFFASPKASGSQESEEPLTGAIQCIRMIRGIKYVIPPIQQWVERGPLAQLLPLHHGNPKSKHAFDDLDTDRYFQKFLVLCSTSSDMNQIHEFEDIEQYAAAASTLRASFLRAESPPYNALEILPFWHWASRLTPGFPQRLEKLHPIPLVLVAHWCVILAQIPQKWWIQGWVDHTMGQIQECLPLKFHEWLEWPAKKIEQQREG